MYSHTCMHASTHTCLLLFSVSFCLNFTFSIFQYNSDLDLFLLKAMLSILLFCKVLHRDYLEDSFVENLMNISKQALFWIRNEGEIFPEEYTVFSPQQYWILTAHYFRAQLHNVFVLCVSHFQPEWNTVQFKYLSHKCLW